MRHNTKLTSYFDTCFFDELFCILLVQIVHTILPYYSPHTVQDFIKSALVIYISEHNMHDGGLLYIYSCYMLNINDIHDLVLS